MRIAHPNICILLMASLLLLAPEVQNFTHIQTEAISLSNPDMAWLEIVEDLATYEWNVDVLNNTGQPVRLRIIFDLLDDDDSPINRDEQNNPQDFVIIKVEPNQTIPVIQQGSLGYDRAAEVITYQVRREILPSLH
ncbi:MAG: hypothetical protein VX398_01605 [Acidobacteriota bacterium]|nr:hypothetical protein [Acidobacteriota bacterium]